MEIHFRWVPSRIYAADRFHAAPSCAAGLALWLVVLERQHPFEALMGRCARLELLLELRHVTTLVRPGRTRFLAVWVAVPVALAAR